MDLTCWGGSSFPSATRGEGRRQGFCREERKIDEKQTEQPTGVMGATPHWEMADAFFFFFFCRWALLQRTHERHAASHPLRHIQKLMLVSASAGDGGLGTVFLRTLFFLSLVYRFPFERISSTPTFFKWISVYPETWQGTAAPLYQWVCAKEGWGARPMLNNCSVPVLICRLGQVLQQHRNKGGEGGNEGEKGAKDCRGRAARESFTSQE